MTSKLSTFIYLLIILMGSITSCQVNLTPDSGSSTGKTSATPIGQATSKSGKTPVTPLKQAARIGNEMGELLNEGQQRTYYLHTPKSYQPNHPMPLVLAFHGYGSQGKDLALNTGFSDLAEQEGFIIVYPNGLERRWNVISSWLTGKDDVSFVSALIDHLKQVRAIDQHRIYATGVSNGGFLVQRLACEPKTQITAFASVVATLPGEVQSFCHPQTPIPLMMINGTDDRKVPWSGGSPPKVPYGWILSVPDTISFWRQHNGCTAALQTKQFPGNRVESDGRFANRQRHRYLNCQRGSEVELITLKGVGHVWPRGGSGPNQLINGSQEIWRFFQRHSRQPPA